MAKKSLIRRNEKRKLVAKRGEAKRQKLLSISKDISLEPEDRLGALIKLSEMPRDSSLIRYRNRCKKTGRPRGNYRKFLLSRIALRELAAWGQIPGLKKSSW